MLAGHTYIHTHVTIHSSTSSRGEYPAPELVGHPEELPNNPLADHNLLQLPRHRRSQTLKQPHCGNVSESAHLDWPHDGKSSEYNPVEDFMHSTATICEVPKEVTVAEKHFGGHAKMERSRAVQT